MGMSEEGNALVYVPTGALTPANWNPRAMYTAEFQQLCSMIRADPGFLLARPILAMDNGTIYAGNQRYRAVCQLYREGWESPLWTTGQIPVILHDITEEQAKARAIRDNNHAGVWQEIELAERLAEIAAAAGEATLPTLGFNDDDLQNILAAAGIGEHIDPGTGREVHPDASKNAPSRPQRGENIENRPGVGVSIREPLTITLRFDTLAGWDYACWMLADTDLRRTLGPVDITAYNERGQER